MACIRAPGVAWAKVLEHEREAWIRENVPVPIRVLHFLLMKRQFDRSMRELYPDRTVPAMV